MSDGAITTRIEGGVLHLGLDRARKANAYTSGMLERLEELVEEADAREDVRVMVVRGSGERAFSAGADLGEIRSRDWRDVLDLGSARVFDRIAKARVVTLAAVNGAAVGGGMELAAACDIRIAVEGATFRLPEPEIGLLPAAGGLSRIPELVGVAAARALILGGEEWSARDAWRLGFVSEVVAGPAELDDAVEAWSTRILRRHPDAIRLAKETLDRDSSSPDAGRRALLAQALLQRVRDA